jgi:hypothetical protein
MANYRGPVDMILNGSIEAGDTDNHRVYLYEDKSYKIYVKCDNGKADLDLAIYDADGDLLGKDNDTDADAAIRLTVSTTQLFKLAVSSARGSSTYTMTVKEQR